MDALRIKRQHKLHWHMEPARRRRLIAQTVAELDALHLVVVRSCLPGENSERRRRKCLERLLYELDQHAVTCVCAEAREAKQNARDRRG